MRIRDLFEVDTSAIAANPGAIDPNAQGSEKVTQLQAAMSGLQKQIQTLQKSALQQASGAPQQATPATVAPPKPGEAGQGQTPKTPVGPGQVVPGATPIGQPAGQPMGQAPAQPGAVQPSAAPQAAQPAANTPPVGVTQSPQLIKSKLQQDLQTQLSK